MNAFGRPVAFLLTNEHVSWSSVHNSCRYLFLLLPKTKAFIPKPEHLATLFYESRQPWGTGHPPPKPWPRYGHSRHMQRRTIEGPLEVVAWGSGATLWVVASAIGSSLEKLRPSQPPSSVGVRWGYGGGTVGTRWGYGGDTVGVRWGHGGGTVRTRWGHGEDTVGTRWGHGEDTVGTRWGHGGDTVGARWGHGQYPEDANRKCSFLTTCLAGTHSGPSGNYCPIA
jgi:hypothetical protein